MAKTFSRTESYSKSVSINPHYDTSKFGKDGNYLLTGKAIVKFVYNTNTKGIAESRSITRTVDSEKQAEELANQLWENNGQENQKVVA